MKRIQDPKDEAKDRDAKIAALNAKIESLEVDGGKNPGGGSAPGSDEDKSDGNRDHWALESTAKSFLLFYRFPSRVDLP